MIKCFHEASLTVIDPQHIHSCQCVDDSETAVRLSRRETFLTSNQSDYIDAIDGKKTLLDFSDSPLSNTRQLLDLRHDLRYLELQPLGEKSEATVGVFSLSENCDKAQRSFMVADCTQWKLCAVGNDLPLLEQIASAKINCGSICMTCSMQIELQYSPAV